jgi:hypothetical protein
MGHSDELLPDGQKLPANRFGPKFSAQALNNQTDWPVIFRITGPICARALKSKIQRKLGLREHHDWPVMPVTRRESKGGGRSTARRFLALVLCSTFSGRTGFPSYSELTSGGLERQRYQEP